jgi:hypothetical protein
MIPRGLPGVRGGPGRLFLALVLACVSAASMAQDWQLRVDEDGLRVETRSVPGSKFKAFRATARVDASPDAVLTRLQDIEAYAEWFPDTTEAFAVHREDGLWANYVRTAAPWPVKDRDAVYMSTLERVGGSLRIDVTAAPDLAEERSDAVRIREASGYWQLSPDGDGTLILWEFHVEPGGSVPAGLANARVVNTPRGALEALRDYFLAVDGVAEGS